MSRGSGLEKARTAGVRRRNRIRGSGWEWEKVRGGRGVFVKNKRKQIFRLLLVGGLLRIMVFVEGLVWIRCLSFEVILCYKSGITLSGGVLRLGAAVSSDSRNDLGRRWPVGASRRVHHYNAAAATCNKCFFFLPKI